MIMALSENKTRRCRVDGIDGTCSFIGFIELYVPVDDRKKYSRMQLYGLVEKPDGRVTDVWPTTIQFVDRTAYKTDTAVNDNGNDVS